MNLFFILILLCFLLGVFVLEGNLRKCSKCGSHQTLIETTDQGLDTSHEMRRVHESKELHCIKCGHRQHLDYHVKHE
jgi:predicted nucleic-acid-binding Zn-ribbon protein